ncbi:MULTISPECIES: DUF751 family protein [unclassified Coleofasciculus]|uniref:DUF751 family protein n=1 Tax=unclassified Coleofasciculus TaxID=2692782 RepID=UPI00188302FF|nr:MULTISPECIES: DUF751 family protein [unclassified Coleofasciculus]MBE9127080.1 DUF751 family protein [Coleofasciculus sp. LEGE 07081]MBE9150468.1 DUF751 family protein [Coleofasciculus sp. LEGE 07092]
MKDFLQNISRYPRYLISITLGIFFALFERFKPLFSNRLSAIAVMGILVGAVLFLIFTLRAMLGLNPVY